MAGLGELGGRFSGFIPNGLAGSGPHQGRCNRVVAHFGGIVQRGSPGIVHRVQVSICVNQYLHHRIGYVQGIGKARIPLPRGPMQGRSSILVAGLELAPGSNQIPDAVEGVVFLLPPGRVRVSNCRVERCPTVAGAGVHIRSFVYNEPEEVVFGTFSSFVGMVDIAHERTSGHVQGSPAIVGRTVHVGPSRQ